MKAGIVEVPPQQAEAEVSFKVPTKIKKGKNIELLSEEEIEFHLLEYLVTVF
jgi:hypothetical protein